jgi:hypothetical protein
MNNLARAFISTSIDSSSDTIARCRIPLLLICLLVMMAGSARAQVVLVQAPPPAQDARATVSGAVGAITGRVVSEDGRPLSDAVIYLNRAYARVLGPPLMATTDSDGRFQVTGLESGLFSLSAMLPGFATQDAAAPAGETNFYRLGDSVNLTLVKGGVITGTVRDSNNELMVAVSVRVVRVRDAMGRSTVNRAQGFSGYLPERMTDDRGIYRIYGLPPGAYVVSAGGGQRLSGIFNAYAGDAPTFFPSSTRDTAAEVVVRGGEEAANIDIRYRGEPGHAVSGTVSGIIDTNMRAPVSISIKQTSSGGIEGATFIMPGATASGFSFNGMSDGEYEIAAQQFGGTSDSAASLPRRVTVKGANVTGVELALLPLASISGRAQLEALPKEKCREGRGATLLETIINARRDEKNRTAVAPGFPFFYNSGGVPTEQGEFTIRNLMPGPYRLTARLMDDAWYVRSVVLPGATPAAAAPSPSQASAPLKPGQAKSGPAAGAAASVVTLKPGERLMNVSVQIAQDAASLSGRVVASSSSTEGTEGAQPPSNLRVYLVPIEQARAEDTLRYGEAVLEGTGAFTFKNLAPGRYRIISRPLPDSESVEQSTRPLFWDALERAKLRREAEAANATIELQPCQRASDYVLRYGAAK